MNSSTDPAEHLTAPEHWFRILAETGPVAILVFRHHILSANRAAIELTDYSEDELRRMTLDDLLAPASERVSLPDDATLLVRRDKERRWVRWSTAYTQMDWQPTGILMAVDITDQKHVEVQLQQTRERFLLARKAARWITWDWNPQTDRLHTSSTSDSFLDWAGGDTLQSGTAFLQRVHAQDRDRLRAAVRSLIEGGTDSSIEVRFARASDEVRWIAVSYTAVRTSSGEVDRLVGVAHDITAQKITENALFLERDRTYVTLSSITDGVIRTDTRGVVDYLNPVAQRLTGWSLAESYGRPSSELYQLVDEETDRTVLDPVQLCLQEQREVTFLGQRLLIRRDGSAIPIHDSATPILDRQGRLNGCILIFRDLTQMRQVEDEIQHLATHDALTGLANRREFEQVLSQILQSDGECKQESALCHLDLDAFKLINDTCGHTAGDQLIRQIATVLKQGLQPGDQLARVGIDEFAILFRDRALAEARELAQEVCDLIHRFRFHWEGRTYSPRVSAGLVPLSPDLPDPEALLSAADAACFVAKESGGGRLHVFAPGDAAIAERYGQMQWVSRIQRGFDEKRFCLWEQRIQPLGGAGTEAPLSELLIRLIDEEGNVVAPGSFIPAAERYGLIDTIDRWVVREALTYMARQAATAGDNQRFAINISGQSLGAEGFLDYIIEQIEETGISSDRILFEITETSAIANLQNAMRFISVLKGMGCLFVLDDFGQGLSSFGYLKNLPLDFIKIDGGFVREMIDDPVQAALVSSIRDIGGVMGLRTIAESVENEATFNALTHIGVDYVQGYYLDRPKPLTTSSPPPLNRRLA